MVAAGTLKGLLRELLENVCVDSLSIDHWVANVNSSIKAHNATWTDRETHAETHTDPALNNQTLLPNATH